MSAPTITQHWLQLDDPAVVPRISGEVYALGDLHGAFERMERLIEKYGLNDAHIIVLGDIGLGFFPMEETEDLEALNERCRVAHTTLWFLRGNHDDPSYWQEPKKSQFETTYSNIRLLAQGPLWVNDELHYAFPGGVTVDRERRIRYELAGHGKQHWEGNEVVFNEVLPSPKPKIKCVLAHTGHVPPTNSRGLVDFFCTWDDKLEEDLDKEQQVVDKVINTLHPDWYIYGHFHNHWKAVQSTPKQLTLDIMELVRLDYDELEGKSKTWTASS